MRRNDLNKGIYSNIKIPEDMKQSLIADVKKGKRNADVRFRYSTALMAIGIIGALGVGGFGASAAYMSYKNRMQEMTVQEKTDYKEELAADTYNTETEAMTRQLTDDEHKRYLELEDEYYKNCVFPKNSMRIVEKESDLSGDELAFVEELNKIHVPEGELSDEELLQLIDHTAKYIYTIEENNKAGQSSAAESLPQTVSEEEQTDPDAEEAVTEDEYDAAFEVSPEDQETIRAQSIALVKEFSGIDIDDSWDINISGYSWSKLDGFDEDWDSYEVWISESDAPNATFFQLQIPLNEEGIFIFNSGGKDILSYHDYTREEAEPYVEEGKAAVLEYVNEHFGLGEPDKVEIYGFENAAGEQIGSEEIGYTLHYGENEIEVYRNIDNGNITSVIGKGLLKNR